MLSYVDRSHNMPDDEQDEGTFEEFDDADVTEGSNRNSDEETDGEAEESGSAPDSEAAGDTVENGYAAAETTATESTDETGTAEVDEAPPTAGVADDRETDGIGPARSGDRPEKSPDEAYCSSCGAVIKGEAEICPECGVRQGAVSGGRTDEKNPGLSALASFIIPGAGQVYNGQIGRGGVFLAALVLLWIFYMMTLGFGILLGIFIEPILHIIAAYDAYNQANKINAGEVQV